MVGGAAVRPDVCPQPTAGATVKLVCAFSSPLLGVGFTLGWRGTAGLFPCAVWSDLRWWAGPQSDPMSVPSPPLGPQSDWCVPYLPLSQGQDSLWSGAASVWATCTFPGLWCCFDGIWHTSRGGSARCTGAGGAGLAPFAIGGPLWEGSCSTRREAGRPLGGMDPQKHSVGCLSRASKFRVGNGFPLGFQLGDGRERDGACPCLCSPLS